MKRWIPVMALLFIACLVRLDPAGQSSAADNYLLPIAAPSQVEVTQGNFGSDHTVKNLSQYAFDFANQSSWTVIAARAGKVIGLESESQAHCTDDQGSCWRGANFVLVDNQDGSSQLYMHFAQGSITVHVGEIVEQGTPLGVTGDTGWSTGVHLHFQVEDTPPPAQQKLANDTAWWWTQSVPVAFSDPGVRSVAANGIPDYPEWVTSSNHEPAPQGGPPSNTSPAIPSPDFGTTAQPPSAQLKSPTPTPTSHPSNYPPPTGTWFSTNYKGATVSQSSIYVAAYVATGQGGGLPVTGVDFQAYWSNAWHSPCGMVSVPGGSGTEGCTISLAGVPPGPVKISFNIYTGGSVPPTLGPDGVQVFTYRPSGPVSPPSDTPTPTATRVPPTHTPTNTPTPVRPTNTPTPTPHPQAWVHITTDKSSYSIGDPVRVCYSISYSAPIVILDHQTDGTTQTLLSGTDDGNGDCSSNLVITGPPGTETMEIDMHDPSGSSVIADDSVSFTVLGQAAHVTYVCPIVGASDWDNAIVRGDCIDSADVTVGTRIVVSGQNATVTAVIAQGDNLWTVEWSPNIPDAVNATEIDVPQ